MKGDLLNLVTQGEVQDKKKSATDEFIIMENYISEVEPMVSAYGNNTASPEMTKLLYTKLRFMKMLLFQIMKSAGLLSKMKDDDEGL